jgi:glucokinase
MILAGDVGGTNTRLGFFTVMEGRVALVDEERIPSRGHRGLEEIVERFVATHRFQVEAACFGIAGPVKGDRAATTNLPWVVDAPSLARGLGISRVWLLNDLEANAWGITALEPQDFSVLHPGSPEPGGNAAVISAGTGLGEAGLYWDGSRHVPFATEGGHADFAPGDEMQLDLLRHLQSKYGHVSWERVLSGPGLDDIYVFLRDVVRVAEPAASIPDELMGPDRPATIANAGLAGACPVCAQAVDLLVWIYGAEAGNLALKIMATGGVFLGGGIAPKILDRLKAPRFLEAFTSKGRMKPLLEAIPIRVILNDRASLIGAAQCAAMRASFLDPGPGSREILVAAGPQTER